jgi:FtsP/CotA-like multicopper oxidase with cupredoxin domain
MRRFSIWLAVGGILVLSWLPAGAQTSIRVQCPGDLNGDAVVDVPDPDHPRARCVHLTGGDGFVNMGDGRRIYIFGFSDVTGVAPENVMSAGMLAAEAPAPTIVVDEGDELYLTLTNVGMTIRPDLFDPHSIHWHGFPQASAVFDGQPDGAISINMAASLTYYYNVVEPGTYMYHCHVEATEHMQMGMLGNLYVRPAQNRLAGGTALRGGFIHQTGHKYAYNDGDGTTRYDVEVPIQIGSFDPNFHDASESVQPLPFAMMKDLYPMLNGRGYPDTINPLSIENTADTPRVSQKVPSLVVARVGQKVLLRISNLNVTNYYTLSLLGLPMKVVGVSARLLRGLDPDGAGSLVGRNLYYDTQSLTLGGGESYDVIVDTAGVTPGTYFLYTTNLNFLNNNEEGLGGMMTEVVINP